MARTTVHTLLRLPIGTKFRQDGFEFYKVDHDKFIESNLSFGLSGFLNASDFAKIGPIEVLDTER